MGKMRACGDAGQTSRATIGDKSFSAAATSVWSDPFLSVAGIVHESAKDETVRIVSFIRELSNQLYANVTHSLGLFIVP